MKSIITVDLGFGDSGKGTIVDALARKYNSLLIVRFNGGCQAAHTVYNDAGVAHTFSQVGASFAPGVMTLLSRYTLVNPLTLAQEMDLLVTKGLRDIWSRVWIDERALMVTPYHRAVNRLRELARGDKKHGSCGHGIGETVSYALQHPNWALTIGSMKNIAEFAGKMLELRDRMQKQANAIDGLPDTDEVARQLSTFSYSVDKLFEHYARFYERVSMMILDDYLASKAISDASATRPVVFEAAQGVLLDEHYGFHPHTTWSTTTTHNARLLLEEAEITEQPTIIGIMRSYATRHGTGPLPTEDQAMTQDMVTADPNNLYNKWQGYLRAGPLDIPLLRYALKANGSIDQIAMTHMDRITGVTWPVCLDYEGGSTWLKPSMEARASMPLYEGQTALGRRLGEVKPVITRVPSIDCIHTVKEQLGVPVGLVSYGPGPKDKLFYEGVPTSK